MTRDEADYALYALIHLERAINALRARGYGYTLDEAFRDARIEIEKALSFFGDTPSELPVVAHDPYSDTTLRPGLNKPLEDHA